MSSIKVSEKFYSSQGEGRYVGVPSVFLRTFGCNFRCKNFGRNKDEIITGPNPEVEEVIKNIAQYKTLDELPLVHTGCDSYPSVYPEFKHLCPTYTTSDLANEIVKLLPYKHWEDEHLIITGGEPLLGWQRAYPSLLDDYKMQSLKELTFETNGTQPLTKEFSEYLIKWGSIDRPFGSITFSVSAKLSCSGEKQENAIKPDIVCNYEKHGFTYLKFVVSSKNEMSEVLDTIDIYRDAGFQGPVYLMAVGGTIDSYNLNNKQVADLALNYGLRYSPRMHLSLYGNAWAT